MAKRRKNKGKLLMRKNNGDVVKAETGTVLALMAEGKKKQAEIDAKAKAGDKEPAETAPTKPPASKK